MAQVLTSVIQTTGPHTMPYSPSDAYKNTPTHSSAATAQQQSRPSQMPRTQHSANSGPTGYRGTAAPIAPYAFSSTPQLRQDNKPTSAPSPQVVQQQLPTPATNQARLGHPSHPSSSSDSTVSTSGSSNRSAAGPSVAAKDDGDVKKPADSTAPSITLSATNLDLSFSVGESPVKPSPGRYRRAPGRTDSSNSVPTGSTTPTQRSTFEGNPQPAPSQQTPNANSDIAAASPQPSRPTHNRANSADDTQAIRTGGMDAAKRYRRRSFNGLEGDNITPSKASLHISPATGQSAATAPATAPAAALSQSAARPSSSGRTASRPTSSRSHERQGSVGSASSNNSSRSQSRPAVNTQQRSYASVAGSSSAKATETNRRQAPSPLSHPISPSESPSQVKPEATSSAAMQQLSAVNDKDKGMKSRLRRAFSFGSAAELRRASAENNISAERARLRKGQYQSDEDAEQAAIIAKQEAAGIGAGIYSGQGGIGSTDNLSIQSAASSASVMLRKMGHGMKKGTKSIKGLFRPKSVIGVPAADGPIKPSVGQVSLVTVEAERHKVNVNAHPHEQTRGGTGYPRLERNSIDAGQTAEIVDPSASGGDTTPRKSIVGSDRDRAEVLSSMKKGILKRTGTNSESGSPVIKPEDGVPNIGSSRSSSPATPKTDAGQARGDDYFTKPPRIHNGSTMSLPTTPHNGIRNISFSPRIQFHDAWSPQDYDRRGDIATCNRLTPMLAQQIKEELNSFKMEMEVHELSKPHTHFF